MQATSLDFILLTFKHSRTKLEVGSRFEDQSAEIGTLMTRLKSCQPSRTKLNRLNFRDQLSNYPKSHYCSLPDDSLTMLMTMMKIVVGVTHASKFGYRFRFCGPDSPIVWWCDKFQKTICEGKSGCLWWEAEGSGQQDQIR